MLQLSNKVAKNKQKNIRVATRLVCRASMHELPGRVRAVRRAGRRGGVRAGVRIDG